jgi:hypothetical protein
VETPIADAFAADMRAAERVRTAAPQLLAACKLASSVMDLWQCEQPREAPHVTAICASIDGCLAAIAAAETPAAPPATAQNKSGSP